MRALIIYSFFFIMLSCSSNNDKQAIDGNLLMPKETKEKKSSLKIKKKEFLDTLKYLSCLNSDSINLKGIILSYSRDKEFIDRFAIDSSLQINIKINSGNSIIHKIHFFRDSVQAKNAFFNWLDVEKGSFVGGKTSLGKSNQIVILTERHFQLFKSKRKLNDEQIRKLSTLYSERDHLIYFLISNKKETVWNNIETYKPFVSLPN